MSVVQARFWLTDAQKAVFEDFFHDDIADGTLSFTWNDPVTDVEAEWQFDAQDPFDMAASDRGEYWDLTVRLEKLT